MRWWNLTIIIFSWRGKVFGKNLFFINFSLVEKFFTTSKEPSTAVEIEQIPSRLFPGLKMCARRWYWKCEITNMLVKVPLSHFVAAERKTWRRLLARISSQRLPQWIQPKFYLFPFFPSYPWRRNGDAVHKFFCWWQKNCGKKCCEKRNNFAQCFVLKSRRVKTAENETYTAKLSLQA